ncbi:helix-turn-helix transcriptional regulator [Alloscardovia criceti]|uniref:helix-turn-helix transcriptional regulator n=1 Tax=Alloscardovia criceti TaxID=356828 RepID=UPI000381ED04|nr:helix-turn-helix transcriptional regulator [Alloscardovia criceti]
MDENITIGRNLASLRKQANISQERLANDMKELGHKWSKATVWSIEQGKRPLRLDEAKSLLLCLDLPQDSGLSKLLEPDNTIEKIKDGFGNVWTAEGAVTIALRTLANVYVAQILLLATQKINLDNELNPTEGYESQLFAKGNNEDFRMLVQEFNDNEYSPDSHTDLYRIAILDALHVAADQTNGMEELIKTLSTTGYLKHIETILGGSLADLAVKYRETQLAYDTMLKKAQQARRSKAMD